MFNKSNKILKILLITKNLTKSTNLNIYDVNTYFLRRAQGLMGMNEFNYICPGSQMSIFKPFKFLFILVK